MIVFWSSNDSRFAPRYEGTCQFRCLCVLRAPNMNMRPQHITITSIKYLISYPINMKVSNQVFTTSNSNKCVGGLYLCMYVQVSV